jgi:hypothetical protein
LALILALCLMTLFLGWWPLLPASALLLIDAVAVRLRTGKQGLPLTLAAILAGRLRALGSLGYYLSYHLVRYYSIPLIAISLLVPIVWIFFGIVLATAAGVDYAIKKPELSFPKFSGIYILEQLAYGAGVFRGCFSRRCFASYRVVIFRQMEQSM